MNVSSAFGVVIPPVTSSSSTTTTSAISQSLQEEMLGICKNYGLESIARTAGVIDSNGEIPSLRKPKTEPPSITTKPLSKPELITTASSTSAKSLQSQTTINPKPESESAAATTTTTTTETKHPIITFSAVRRGRRPKGTNVNPQTTSSSTSPQPISLSTASTSTENDLAVAAAVARALENAAPQLTSNPNYINTMAVPNSALSGLMAQQSPATSVVTTNANATTATPTSAEMSGLKHFSTLVWEKVEILKVTTYKKVADELVQDAQADASKGVINDQNLKRRVYDILNVFAALGIIEKVKKDIRWRGLSSSTEVLLASISIDSSNNLDSTTTTAATKVDEKKKKEDIRLLQRQKRRMDTVIERKRQKISELEVQATLYDQVVERNRQKGFISDSETSIQLPFLIVHTNSTSSVECERGEDRKRVNLRFDQQFEVSEDVEMLELMGLQNNSISSSATTTATTTTTFSIPIPNQNQTLSDILSFANASNSSTGMSTPIKGSSTGGNNNTNSTSASRINTRTSTPIYSTIAPSDLAGSS